MSFQDGSNPFGSFVMTIGTLGYPLESAEYNYPTSEVEVRNAVGDPSGWICIPGFITGRGTAQLPTGSYPVPTLGAIFTYAAISGTVTTYSIKTVGQPYGQQEIYKVNVEFRKRLNS